MAAGKEQSLPTWRFEKRTLAHPKVAEYNFASHFITTPGGTFFNEVGNYQCQIQRKLLCPLAD
jgi:hypothetical protein